MYVDIGHLTSDVSDIEGMLTLDIEHRMLKIINIHERIIPIVQNYRDLLIYIYSSTPSSTS